MKIKIGNGTTLDCSSIEVDGPVLKAYAPAKKGKTLVGCPLLLAYHLHPGETVRLSQQSVDGEEAYEVNQ